MFAFNRNGFSRSLSPYVFTGIGVTGRDSAAAGVTRGNWSYGAGLSVPFGRSVDVFGEERWRMLRYVLPTAANAPSPQSEFRFGLSFHFGGGSSTPSGRRGRRDMLVGDATCVDSSGPALLRSGLSVLRH
jgi:hypothetical protein